MSDVEAKNFYKNHWINPVAEMNWKYLSNMILKDHSIFTTQRLTKEKLEFSMPEIIETCFASELFADENPQRLLVAESELDTHDDLREKNTSTAPRISGDLIKLKILPFQFFQLDCVMGTLTDLPTNRKLGEVSDWLLSQEIIPLDADFMFIKPQTNWSLEN